MEELYSLLNKHNGKLEFTNDYIIFAIGDMSCVVKRDYCKYAIFIEDILKPALSTIVKEAAGNYGEYKTLDTSR